MDWIAVLSAFGASLQLTGVARAKVAIAPTGQPFLLLLVAALIWSFWVFDWRMALAIYPIAIVFHIPLAFVLPPIHKIKFGYIGLHCYGLQILGFMIAVGAIAYRAFS